MHTPTEDSEDITLDTADENRDAVLSLAGQAHFSLKLFTRDLDPRVFDNPDFERCIFRLATMHRSSKIHILVSDITSAMRRGHCLIRLAQKLTSSVFIHKPAREHKGELSTFMIVDGTGLLHRPRSSSNNYQAIVNYRSPQRAGELDDHFNEMWERSTPDAQIRRLYI